MPDFDRMSRCEVTSVLENVRQMVALCRDCCRTITERVAPGPIRSVGIVGAGIMGTAIAIEHARRSIPVVLMDASSDALRRAEEITAHEVEADGRLAGRLMPSATITCTADEADLAGCDLVLESIVEKRQAKHDLLSRIQPVLADHAILATNTSTIPLARLAPGLVDPARFCGLHFCHPVRMRPLVEVIPGPATSPKTLATAVAHATFLGKLPLVVADTAGFIVNRLLMAYLDGALALVVGGAPIESVDAAMVEFGMPLGPLELLDEIGLDTALQSGVILADVLGARGGGSELLLRLVKAKQNGMKAGSGFYNYPQKSPNPSVGRFVNALCASEVTDRKAPVAAAAIADRLLAPMIAEGTRMLAEKTVSRPWKIDLAMIFGLGFPLWRRGLMRSAGQLELDKNPG